MMFLATIWSKFQSWIIMIGVVALAVAGAYFYGKHEQRLETKAEQAEERIKTIKKVREIEDEVQSLPESDLDRRLDKWMRD